MLLLPLGKCRSEMSHTAWAVVGRLTACNRATAVNSYRRFSLYKESGKPSRSCTSVSNLPRGCSFASSCGHSASLTGASSYSLEWPELHTSRGYSSMKGRSGLRPPKKAHWTKLKFTQECDPQSVFNRLKWWLLSTQGKDTVSRNGGRLWKNSFPTTLESELVTLNSEEQCMILQKLAQFCVEEGHGLLAHACYLRWQQLDQGYRNFVQDNTRIAVLLQVKDYSKASEYIKYWLGQDLPPLLADAVVKTCQDALELYVASTLNFFELNSPEEGEAMQDIPTAGQLLERNMSDVEDGIAVFKMYWEKVQKGTLRRSFGVFYNGLRLMARKGDLDGIQEYLDHLVEFENALGENDQKKMTISWVPGIMRYMTSTQNDSNPPVFHEVLSAFLAPVMLEAAGNSGLHTKGEMYKAFHYALSKHGQYLSKLHSDEDAGTSNLALASLYKGLVDYYSRNGHEESVMELFSTVLEDKFIKSRPDEFNAMWWAFLEATMHMKEPSNVMSLYDYLPPHIRLQCGEFLHVALICHLLMLQCQRHRPFGIEMWHRLMEWHYARVENSMTGFSPARNAPAVVHLLRNVKGIFGGPAVYKIIKSVMDLSDTNMFLCNDALNSRREMALWSGVLDVFHSIRKYSVELSLEKDLESDWNREKATLLLLAMSSGRFCKYVMNARVGNNMPPVNTKADAKVVLRHWLALSTPVGHILGSVFLSRASMVGDTSLLKFTNMSIARLENAVLSEGHIDYQSCNISSRTLLLLLTKYGSSDQVLRMVHFLHRNGYPYSVIVVRRMIQFFLAKGDLLGLQEFAMSVPSLDWGDEYVNTVLQNAVSMNAIQAIGETSPGLDWFKNVSDPGSRKEWDEDGFPSDDEDEGHDEEDSEGGDFEEESREEEEGWEIDDEDGFKDEFEEEEEFVELENRGTSEK